MTTGCSRAASSPRPGPWTRPPSRCGTAGHGAAWQALAAGVAGQASALAVNDGDLCAAGVFQRAGGQPVNYIARWDGAAWHGLDSGLSNRALALGEYHSDLIVGGKFLF